MPILRVDLPDDAAGAPDWPALRNELGIASAFGDRVEAEAESVATRRFAGDRADLRNLEFFTLDPEGSLDLDQAMLLEREGSGYCVRYAIADVSAFVDPGGLLDAESHRRGETFYSPDQNELLYPSTLSEGTASLLPEQDRAALVWELHLAATGELTSSSVTRALVRSQRKLNYDHVQALFDSGQADDQLALLEEIGKRRQALASHRGAVDLPTPEQVVTQGPHGDAELSYRAPALCESWNAQISLLTGMAAAQMMLAGGVGLLRTLPTPETEAVESLRRSAAALGIAWPEGSPYGSVLSALDPSQPAAAALLSLATRLLRGAAYTAFDGSPPLVAIHSAVAAPYAHCTAPLRRLADRYVGEVCVALSARNPVPEWVRQALPLLPAEMLGADRKAHALERATVDLAEAFVLERRVGEEFDASVVELNKRGALVQIKDPAVRGVYVGTGAELGKAMRIRLISAVPSKREVVFGPVL